MPRVTAIIATYNRSAVLGYAIRSAVVGRRTVIVTVLLFMVVRR